MCIRDRFRDNPFAIPLTQLISEPLRMSIPPELDLALGLQDPTHGPQRAHQPVVLGQGFMWNGIVNRPSCDVIEALQLVGSALPLVRYTQIQPSPASKDPVSYTHLDVYKRQLPTCAQ